LLGHLGKDGLSNQERASTLVSLKDAYEEEILKMGRRRQWHKALYLLHEMEVMGVDRTSSIYAAAAQACAERTQDWPRAFGVLEELWRSAIQANARPYNSVIKACVKGKQPDKAMAVLHEMRSRNVDLDRLTYDSMLAVASRGGHWELALNLLVGMEENIVYTNWKHYNKALHACSLAGQEDWVETIEDEAAARGYDLMV